MKKKISKQERLLRNLKFTAIKDERTMSFVSGLALEDLIRELDANTIILEFTGIIRDRDGGSIINMELARLDVSLDEEINWDENDYDYKFRTISYIWDDSGKLIKSHKSRWR